MPWTRELVEGLEQAERHDVIAFRREAQGGRKVAEWPAGFETQFVPRTVVHYEVDVTPRRECHGGRNVQPPRVTSYAFPRGAFKWRLFRVRIADPEPHAVQPTDGPRPRAHPGPPARPRERISAHHFFDTPGVAVP